MKQKIIILILIIPIILIFTTSVVIKKTAIVVNPTVTSVSVDGRHTRVVDIAKELENNPLLKIEAIVMPKDVNVTLKYTIEEVENKPQAKVEVTDDGVVIPKSLGWVKVRVNAMDRSDAVTFNFICSEPLGIKTKDMNKEDVKIIEFEKEEITINVGEETTITEYLPLDEELQEKYNIGRDYLLGTGNFSIQNVTEQVLVITDKFSWKVTGVKKGSSYVSVTYKYVLLDENGNISNEEKTIKILVNVI